MATKTPKSGLKNSSVSPNKISRPHTQSVANDQSNGQDYVVLDKDLVRGVSEKEVEIEHLKA